jgi:hypothetical protein
MREGMPPGIHDEPLFAKQTALMALVLVSVVVGGFFMVAISLKLNGYPSEHVHWRDIPVFVRNHGFHLLWIPVAWTIVAVVAQRRDRGQFYSGVFWAGAILAIVLFTTYFVAAYDPFTRPLILHRGPPATDQSSKGPGAK